MFHCIQLGSLPAQVRWRNLCFIVYLAALCLSVSNSTMGAEYPATRRVEHNDNYHGVTVADPYRWLEADVRESDEVAAWVEAQSEFAREHLDSIPQREVFARRLAELYDYPRWSTPSRKGGKFFYFKNDGLQDQAVLYVAESPSDEGRVLLDPNTWSDDGTVALASYSVSEDGSLLAYAKSESGSDWKTIHVLGIDSGQLRDDHLEWVRFGGVDWDHDNQGFYYATIPSRRRASSFNRWHSIKRCSTIAWERPSRKMNWCTSDLKSRSGPSARPLPTTAGIWC